MTDSYVCSICGQAHSGAPLSWGPDAPQMWDEISPAEREHRGEITTDQCVIDEKYFFIRGRIEIPVADSGDVFAWLVWAEVNRDDFDSISELWEVNGRETKAPIYTAHLANQLPTYECPTLGLEVRLHTRQVGVRPFIEAVGSHRLSDEQHVGISSHQVQTIADQLLGTDN